MRASGIYSIILLALFCTSCAPPPKAAEATPSDLFQRIPAADRAQYSRVTDMRKWRNPYLIVRADAIVYFDATDNAEIVLKPGEVLDKLSELPATAWPYGRVVAVAEGKHESEQGAVEIRKNKGILGGILSDAHVAIDWVPSS